ATRMVDDRRRRSHPSRPRHTLPRVADGIRPSTRIQLASVAFATTSHSWSNRDNPAANASLLEPHRHEPLPGPQLAPREPTAQVTLPSQMEVKNALLPQSHRTTESPNTLTDLAFNYGSPKGSCPMIVTGIQCVTGIAAVAGIAAVLKRGPDADQPRWPRERRPCRISAGFPWLSSNPNGWQPLTGGCAKRHHRNSWRSRRSGPAAEVQG
ncbi:MAG: hypothetical protein RLY70_1814, partial [Planctomycetota bacterium]